MKGIKIRFSNRYTFLERIGVLLALAFAGGCCLYFIHYKLDQFLEASFCITFLGVNGFSWLWGGLCVGPALLLLLSFLMVEAKNCTHALRVCEYPHPDKKVFFRTQILTGKKAKIKGFYILLVIVLSSLVLLLLTTLAFHPPAVDESVYAYCS